MYKILKSSRIFTSTKYSNISKHFLRKKNFFHSALFLRKFPNSLKFYSTGNGDKFSAFDFKEFLKEPKKYIEDHSDEVLDKFIGPPGKGLIRGYILSNLTFFRPLFQFIHAQTGMDYWLIIMLVTVSIRLCLVPFYLIPLKEDMKLRKYKKELDDFKLKKKFAQTRAEKTIYQHEFYNFNKKVGIKYWKKLLPIMIQVPFFIPMFVTLKDLGKYIPLLQTHGILWFKDLSVPDPYFILPILNALLIFLNIKYSSNEGARAVPKWVAGLSMVFTAAFTAKFSSSLFLFWIPLQVINLMQNFLFTYAKNRMEKKEKILDLEKEEENFTIFDSAYEENE